MTSEYVPIDCGSHSLLEHLAMRRLAVVIEALDDAGPAVCWQGRVQDVRTRDGAEFLVQRDAAGADRALRLDGLQAVYDSEQSVIWRQVAADRRWAI